MRLNNLTFKICDRIKYPIQKNNIQSVCRVYQKSNDYPKPLIVRLLSKKKLDDILVGSKQKRIFLRNKSINGIHIDDILDSIFINEHLTFSTKHILKFLKIRLKVIITDLFG